MHTVCHPAVIWQYSTSSQHARRSRTVRNARINEVACGLRARVGTTSALEENRPCLRSSFITRARY